MTRLLWKLRRLREDRRGNAMIEFAIGGSLLVAAFTGTFQFGYAFYQYNSLENAVNLATRYAAIRAYDSSTTTPSDAFKNAVKNMVVYGDPAGGTFPVLPGLTTSNVTLTVTFTNNVPTAMTVAVTGYTLDAAVTTINLSNKPKATYPYQGIYSPA